jgi:tetratricopeptide (TPR) repeat protein
VKLVNCEDGEETEYVKNDSILSKMQERTEGIYRNVLTPMRAKGLEFPSVVLYCFGETAPHNFRRILNGEVTLKNEEERLPLEYYFNRLYVAASRAKNQLVIVESNNALKEFWCFATDPDVVSQLMHRAGGSEKWNEVVTYLAQGTDGAWSGENIDPREQAEDYAAQGRRKRDPFLLRQAGLAYSSAGHQFESGRCFALAAEFEGKYQEAGDKYYQIELRKEAFRCYWKARHWSRLCELSAQETSLTSRLESRAADYMSRGDKLDAIFLDNLIAATKDDAWLLEVSVDATWREVLTKTVERLAQHSSKGTVAWPEVNAAFSRLACVGIQFSDFHYGAIAYAADNFEEAVSLWERCGKTDKGEYIRAKAHITPFPESLVWFWRLKDGGEVLRQWHDHSLTPFDIEGLSDNVVRAVTDAALDAGNLSLVKSMIQQRPDSSRIVKLIKAALESDDNDTASSAAGAAVRLLIKEGAWKAALEATESAAFPELPEKLATKLHEALERVDGGSNLLRVLVHELAVSEALPMEKAERQSTITQFLRRHFIDKADHCGFNHMDVHEIPPQEIGAAFERAGKIVDSLKFYHNLRKNAPSSEIKRFAEERIICNLERHAEYYRSKGNEQQAQRLDQKAMQFRKGLGIGTRALPEYPHVDRKSPYEQTQWVRGPFKISLSPVHGRLRIENTDHFETVTIDMKDCRMRGDASFSEPASSGEGSISWSIPKWNTSIELIIDGKRLLLKIGNNFRIFIHC